MATTDYDAPRPSSVEDPDTESLDAITTARKEAQSPNVDLDEGDTVDGLELPGADLSGEELTMPVIGETGRRIHLPCFPVRHRSRLASAAGGPGICLDCA